jgi:formate hydrogenlyase transcriptional activator
MEEEKKQTPERLNKMEERFQERRADPSLADEPKVASKIALDQLLRFEQLMSDLSAHFVNISPERVVPTINWGMGQLLEFLQVDRCALLHALPDKNSWLITNHVARVDVPPVSRETKLPVSISPWAFDKLIRKREVLSVSSLEKLPPEAKVDKRTWSDWGIRSALVIPINIDESVEYVFTIDSIKSEKVWPEEYIPRLRLLGGIFVNALEASQIRQQIDDRLRFESLINNLSTGFANLTTAEIDDKIKEGLGYIAEFFGVDRCAIGLFSEDGTRFNRAFEYYSAGVQPPPESVAREQWSWYLEQLMRGRSVVVNGIEDLPPEAENERQYWTHMRMKSLLSIPLVEEGKTKGSFIIVSVWAERVWPEEFISRLRLLGEMILKVIERVQNRQRLEEQFLEIQQLKQRLEKENVYLREEVTDLTDQTEIVGDSPAIKSVLTKVRQVAALDSTVLIQGETGTGKELLARAIHRMSGRKDRSMIKVNCASLPPSLIESELFGRERGAYTGALTKMAGRFETADRSTLFLDEIAEVPLELQSKLLSVLEDGNFERLGSTKTLHVNVRIVAASNRNIEQMVREGKFREDLFYRLNVFPILIPPLRERREDIQLLVWGFVKEFEKSMGKRIDSISSKDMEALQSYSWPGNIRELRNVIERAIILSNSRKLDIPITSIRKSDNPEKDDLAEIERQHILSVLERTNWRLTGKGGSAEILGLKRTTLQSMMKKLGILRPKDMPK